MPGCRNTLHKTKLEAFKAWLDYKWIPYREGKGKWQVLQVFTNEYGWQCIFSKLNAPEHFSVNEKLMPTVRKFLNETKEI